MNFVTISKKEYKTLKRRAVDAKKISKHHFRPDLASPFVGMWKKRGDMRSAVSWVRSVRKREDTRSQK